MKNLRNFIMAFVGFIAVAMCVTSCLSNEDDSLSQEEQKRYQQIVSGTKQGKIRFFRQQGTRAYNYQQTFVKYDSISTDWVVKADSFMYINRFPVYALDSAIIVNKDATGAEADKYRSLNQAIRAMKGDYSNGYEKLEAMYAIPSKGWISDNYFQFMISPKTIERTINFDGADHKVYFIFYSNNGGAFITSTQQYQASLILYAICIDKPDIQNNAIPSKYFNFITITLEGKSMGF